MDEMPYYDRDVEQARRALEAALEHREKMRRATEGAEERLAAEEAEKARAEKARADVLGGLSLSFGILHPDAEGGEEETEEMVEAIFDFRLDRKGEGRAVFQSVRGPPECGFLTQLPVKLSHVTKLFHSLGRRDLEPFEVRGVVRCSGANHRAQNHEGVLSFAGFKTEDLEKAAGKS